MWAPCKARPGWPGTSPSLQGAGMERPQPHPRGAGLGSQPRLVFPLGSPAGTRNVHFPVQCSFVCAIFIFLCITGPCRSSTPALPA